MRILLASCLLALLLGAGCGDDEKPRADGSTLYPDLYVFPDVNSGACSANNCLGCCQGNTCLTSPTDTACGYGGQACAPCQTGYKCVSGICQQDKCDSTNCSGCCDSSKKCQNGTSSTLCGTGGGTCTACTGNYVCVSGKCGTKGSGTYKVILVSLTMVSSVDCGWPFDGTCDPYVVLTVGSIKATSSIKADTNSPTWNETLLIATESQITSKFEGEVWDDDIGWDQDLGDCTAKVTSKEIGEGKLTVECGYYTSLGFTKTSTVNFKFEAM